MMNRKERRAAEHAARKAARKAGFPPTTPTPNPANDSAATITRVPCEASKHGPICDDVECPECTAYLDEEPIKPAISDARLAANRQNAKLSTGPTSAAGLLKVSTNALKTGLKGRTVLLPFDDRDAYGTLMLSYQKEFTPAGPVEKGLVQSLVDTCWRLERIPGLEYALLESGYNQLGKANPTVVANAPESMIELQIRIMHEKQFRNLHIQENRLVSRRNREMKELRTLQEVRKTKEAEDLKAAAQVALAAEHNQQPFHLADLGFEFETRHFTTYMARLTPAMKQNLLKEALATTSAAAA